MIGRRIVVVGTSGAGKSTLGGELAAHLGYPWIELDAVHWGPNWTAPATDVFRERVQAALAGDCWVASGNYGSARDIIWSRADTLIWLDLPMRVLLPRLIRRTVRRVWSGEELWTGNQERLRDVFARDNVILYAVQTYRQRRRTYEQLAASGEYGHLHIVRLRTPREVTAWWTTFTGSKSSHVSVGKI